MSLFSVASEAATEVPTWPAPRIRIFMLTLAAPAARWRAS
jgi:hypothetical protein